MAATNENADGDEEATAKGPNIKVNVKFGCYALFVILLALISAGYTIFGGLKAVIWTDFLQSMLLLVAGVAVAWLTFSQLGDSELANPGLGGWETMMQLDGTEEPAKQRMRIYQPSHHKDLPWTGVLTGLFAMHCFYWGTNQFIVQRALGARSDTDAKLGIVAAGFLKLLIPFFAIAPGVAAYYLFKQELPGQKVAPDAVFPTLVQLVIPAGYGLIGIIGAGLIGAILSSIDSMMNSAATIVTFDIYKKYIKPDATDAEMIRAGRISIVGFVVVATLLALFVMDPNSKKNFFLQIADYQNYLTPGILVAFFMGMFWKRGTATGAFCAIIAGIALSWVAVQVYDGQHKMPRPFFDVLMKNVQVEDVKLSDLPDAYKKLPKAELLAAIEEFRPKLTSVSRTFGPTLNFFHRVVFVIPLAALVHILVSLLTQPNEEKSRLNWTDLGGHSSSDLKSLVSLIILSILVFAVLAATMVKGWFIPGVAALIAAVWTFAVFQFHISSHRRIASTSSNVDDNDADTDDKSMVPLMADDRFWASLLCSAAVFMHYYYY